MTTTCLVPVRFISSIYHMYMTDFAYDGPIFLVPLSPSYPSSPVIKKTRKITENLAYEYSSESIPRPVRAIDEYQHNRV